MTHPERQTFRQSVKNLCFVGHHLLALQRERSLVEKITKLTDKAADKLVHIFRLLLRLHLEWKVFILRHIV